MMMNADWLPVLMDGAFSEVYVVDRETLRLLEVNQAGRTNLQRDSASLLQMTLPSLARNMPASAYRALLDGLESDPTRHVVLDATHIRHDGSTYPVELRLYRPATCIGVGNGTGAGALARPVYIAIGHDLTERYEAARALRLSEARFRAIVSNTPGLVYQFVMHPDGEIGFPYLSEGCLALLGISAERLQADAARFLALILPEDRHSYTASMMVSAADKKSWNWEGRIWIEQWKDIKWINLRATPRALPNDSVQWEGIMTNITQSKLEEEEVKHSRAQLAELSAHVEKVKEQERMRIAREIHDDLGGNLTAIKMALALLARRLTSEPNLVEKAEYLDSLVDRTIESVHRISGDLRPSVLDFGLVAAIEWQAKEFEKQFGLPCEVVANRKEIKLSSDQATALFRIFQEALTNIGKHAHASRVRVDLVRGNRNVRLQIADNGRGIANEDRMKPKSFGIRGMVERANALGGTLAVSPGAGGGSVVAVRVPLVTHIPGNDSVSARSIGDAGDDDSDSDKGSENHDAADAMAPGSGTVETQLARSLS